MILNIVLIIFGLGLLVAGAEGLVRGAASLAVRLRIPPLVIGLTIVSFGTSAPELTVNIIAALNGTPDLAVGNIVGSNIANILLILGICALVIPLRVKGNTVWKEIPLALLGMVLLFVMGNDALFDGMPFNALTRTDGIVLMSLMAIFLYYIYGLTVADRKQVKAEAEDNIVTYPAWLSVTMTVAGLVGLVLGGRMLVNGAVGIAQAAGLSDALIGLTIVAIGTSLPELATSLVAALRGHDDIAIGNVVGSNIFNAAANVDVLAGIGATALLFAFMFLSGRHRLVRWQGGLFIGLYVGYLAYIVMRG